MDNDSDGRIERLLSELPESIEPPERVWAGIRAGIEPASARPALEVSRGGERLLPFAAVAALALSVGLGLFRSGSAEGVVEVVAPAATPSLQTVSYAGTASVGPAFVQTRSELLSRLEQLLVPLPAAARESVRGDLERLHESQAELATALEHDPGNAQLKRLLMNSYQREIALLEELNGLLTDVRRPRRTDI